MPTTIGDEAVNLRDPNVKRLAEVARRQGWRLQERGNELVWYPPDTGQRPVHTPKRWRDEDVMSNLAHLRRAGLKDRDEHGHEAKPEPPAAALTVEEVPAPAGLAGFSRTIAELIEQELERRTRNLQDQVEALHRDNEDLRQRLAEAEHDVESRAEAVAVDAVRRMLAERRVQR